NYIWDEVNGHDAIAAAIARGVAPPLHPLFPGEPFRYHFGFDVLAGSVRAFTRITITHAIDVVTIVSYMLLLMSTVSLGARLGGRSAASLALILVPFGSGTLAWALERDVGPLQIHALSMPRTWYANLPPPVISNFFQHPQGLA